MNWKKGQKWKKWKNSKHLNGNMNQKKKSLPANCLKKIKMVILYQNFLIFIS